MQSTSEHAAAVVQAVDTRRQARRLAELALVIGALLALLWWLDPARAFVPVCAFHAITGLHCPGCGATRATHELLNGRLLAALQYNALWIVSLPIWLYAGASQARRYVYGRLLPADPTQKRWTFVILVAAALAFGLLRNLPVWPLDLLAPPG